METFKKPLTPEEENRYIRQYMSGDTHAREVLIEYNLRLVAHIARKYTSSTRDSEDLISIRERNIIIMRYGLTGSPPLTQKEVADILNISRSYVSRIEKRALCKLRGCLDH